MAAFGRMIRDGANEGLPELQREIHPPDPGERELIARLDRCLKWLASLPESDRREIADSPERPRWYEGDFFAGLFAKGAPRAPKPIKPRT